MTPGRITAPATGQRPPTADDELRARIALALTVEPGDEVLGSRLQRCGARAAVEWVRAADGAAARRLRALPPDAVDRALAATDAIGARVVVPGDREWPTQLDDLGAATPCALWVLGAGDLRLLALRSVAVVGARAATPYGEVVARSLASGLAGAGWVVVSGGAFGIDAAAHRGALAAEAPTICLLASAVDVPYPRAHDALLARIADEGLLVSEAPPGSPAYRRRFLSRNRVIAALTRGTVVVEAAFRSGSLNTARTAEGLRRPVMAVPGPVTSPMSAGVHALLREGRAVLVTGSDEVLEVVGGAGECLPEAARGPDTAHDVLSDREALVHDALSRRHGLTVDDIAVRTGLAGADVTAALGVLRAYGLATAADSGWIATRPA